ncbi:MDR family MFS transporter [Lacticaseibacillus mingshuiensis]|uniref:MDR family MFS transporter n=1 Tax=Lacticaseibacillus mingshuiensis TaxID=2799574 RepID=UPI00194E1C09|nr:MDR family MFS transporter [Lacticaseibacillus mingshuiensis]
MTKKNTNVAVVTVAIFIATFMTAIEGTIVSTAMPTIVGSLHGVKLMNWVYSVYLLTNAMATPIYGKFSDRIGRKPVFMLGLVIFVIGSLLSGLSQSMPVLIVFRAIQGIGAGAIMPVTFTIIADIYPFEKRAKVLGFNGSAWGIASVVAPLLGGFIVDQLSWHWIFIINVPIGLFTLALVWFYLVETPQHSKAPIDLRGAVWLMTTLLALMLGFQALAGINGLLWLAAALVVAGFTLWQFIQAEKQAEDPIISLHFFKNKPFVIANAIAALISGFVIGFEAYMPMWMQGILGLGATLGGFSITPSSVMWVVGSFVAGRMMAKLKIRTVLTVALVDLLGGALALALVPQATPYWGFLIIAGFLGFGFGIVITTTTVRAQAVVEPDEVGTATSFNTLSRTLGQTLMVSVYGVVINLHLAQGVAAHKNVTSGMLDKLINSQTAGELPAKLLPTLHQILYEGLHNIYFFSVVIVALALIINQFDRTRADRAVDEATLSHD